MTQGADCKGSAFAGVQGQRPWPFWLPLVGLLLAAAILALQFAAGAYRSEFGEDEASHYISGLLLHDYVAAGLPMSPLDYVRSYHSHYPLVGIGHWPPLYYLIEAVWMLLFSPARASVLLLSAGVTLATALLLYASLVRRAGPLAAAVAAGIFVAAPIVQNGSDALMLDIPVALVCLLAMRAYARYLGAGQARDSVLFALLAFVAIMIKGNGACLALLPPCAVLIGRRFDLLRQPSFWLPLPIVGVLAAPWYWLTYGKVAAGFRYAWGLDYLLTATAGNGRFLLASLGLPIVLLAAAGWVAVAARPRPAGSGMVAAASLLAAVWVFQTVVPAALQDRYLAPTLPPLLILAAFALAALLERLAPAGARARLLGGLLALAFLVTEPGLERKPRSGVAAAVARIMADPLPGNPAVLIATDSAGEAQAVAEIAMRDTARPRIFAVRGSRLLGGGGYNDQDYMPRYRSADEVMAAIDAQAIPTVLAHDGGGPHPWLHVRQVLAAVTAYPDRWRPLGRVDPPEKGPAGAPVLLFRVAGNDARPADTARLMALSAPHGLAAP